MNLFDRFLMEMEGFDSPKSQSISFLNHVTLSSRLAPQPSNGVVEFLSKTRNQETYKLYRGLSLDGNEFSSLKPGDEVPDNLARPNGNQTVIHTTSDIDVARKYASGKDVSFVYEIEVSPDQVLFDANNLSECFDDEDMSDDKLKYFLGEKEVMLFRNAVFKATVLEVK